MKRKTHPSFSQNDTMTSSSSTDQQMREIDIEEGLQEQPVIHERDQIYFSDDSFEFSFEQRHKKDELASTVGGKGEHSLLEHNQDDHPALPTQGQNEIDIEEGTREPYAIHGGGQNQHSLDNFDEFTFHLNTLRMNRPASNVDGKREHSFQDHHASATQPKDMEHNQENHPTSSTKEQVCKDLVNSIMENLSLHSGRISSPVSIYKVPSKLRKVNEEAYTPRLVSIGPYHHGIPELRAMERLKWRFLNKYLGKTGMSFDIIAKVAIDLELSVRQCYQDSFDNISSKDFSEMVLLDGIFLVMLFQKTQITNDLIQREELIRSVSEEIDDYCNSKDSVESTSYHVSQNSWVRSDVLRDIMLLENQLPFFVLQKFYFLEDSRLSYHIFDFFSEVGSMKKLKVSAISNKPKHLVDFLRSYHCPELDQAGGDQIEYTRTATELYEAGVKFKTMPGPLAYYNLFKIKFVRGQLIIPALRIDEHTETLFRNLIAFEQCDIRARKDVTSYIILLRSFISTQKDVDLFVRYGIIQNTLGDHEQVAKLIKNLHNKSAGDEKDFYFASLCNELNEYNRDYCHQWKADLFRWKRVLRRDYFNNPWSSISVIAAIILLLFSAIQAVGSIISMFQW